MEVSPCDIFQKLMEPHNDHRLPSLLVRKKPWALSVSCYKQGKLNSTFSLEKGETDVLYLNTLRQC